MAAAPLTETEITDVRRFTGYPAYGSAGPNNDPFQRYFVAYIQVEYRIRNLSDPENVITRAKLAELRTLDAAIATAGDRLSTDQAAVWYRNKNEAADRVALFRSRRLELCGFLGVGPGPALASANSVRLVV